MNIVADWPGSTHDSTIFNSCRLKARIEIGEFAYGLRCKLETSLTVIVATAVLHNIAQEMNEADPPPPENLSIDEFHYLIESGNVPRIASDGNENRKDRI
ncbi:hypothetical protein HUJ05_001756 [Dendroctonus ponderosae]|nr:hypothetical protein HUJ05_001756 [Dendroctonus ponderosae]